MNYPLKPLNQLATWIFSLPWLPKRHSDKSSSQIETNSVLEPSNPACPQTFAPKLPKIIVYAIRMMILYSLCYFLYTIVTFGLHFACNTHTTEQKSLIQQPPPLNELGSRSLQEIYPSTQEKGGGMETESPAGQERFLQSFISNTFQTLFQTSMTVGSTLLSRDGNTAFVARLDTASNCSLQIMDISNRTSPIFLGNVSFAMTYTGEYPMGNSLALSSDEQIILMATGSDLQIVNVSDKMSPIGAGVFPLTHRENIQSISLSSDSKTAFLVTYIASLESPYSVRAVNITISQSPEFIMTLFGSGELIKLFIFEELLAVCTEGTLLTFKISDLNNIVQEPAELLFDTFHLAPLPSLVQVNSNFEFAYWIFYSANLSIYRLYSYNVSANDNTAEVIDLSDDIQPYIDSSIPQSLFISPTGRHLFWISDQIIQPYDISKPLRPVQLPSISLSSVNCISMSLDERTLLVGAGDQFYMLQLYFNIPPDQVVNAISIVDNILGKFDNDNVGLNAIYQLALSLDGTILFQLSPTGISLLDVSDPLSPQHLLPNFLNESVNQIAVSPNEEVIFCISFSSNSTHANITNFTLYNGHSQVLSSVTFDNSYYTPYSQRQTIQSFVITPDGKIALVIQNFTSFFILDISTPNKVSALSFTTYSSLSVVSIAVSKDGKTVFIAGISMDPSSASTSSLRVYDISIPSSPKLISEFDQILGVMTSMTLSYDDTVAYVFSEPSDPVNFGGQGMCTLNIINISSLYDPVFITSMNLNDNCGDTQSGPFIPVTSNLHVLVTPLEDAVVYVDVSNSSAPKLMDVYYQPSRCVIASHDFKTLYMDTYQSTIIAGVLPENVLSLSSETLLLGYSLVSALNVLTINSDGTYDSSESNNKFIDFELHYPTIAGGDAGFTSLPNWINVDETNGFITFSPNSASQIGSYYIYATFSPQLSFKTFASALNKTGVSINETDASRLLVDLIELGYVDNELFISDFVSTSVTSPLSAQYQSIKEAVSSYLNSSQVPYIIDALVNILKTVVTKFTVNPSLALTVSDSSASSLSSMAITTLSSAPLSLVITLQAQGTQPQFVTTGYSFTASFSNNNSQISMVRSLEDVNTVLSQLIIFLNGSEYCNGTVTVVDDLNPTLNQPVFNISQYFLRSSPPVVNTTYLQNQLAKVFPETGTQFAIQFDTSTFSDLNNQPLSFTLQMQDSSLQTPDWLELKGYTLIGTPPDQLTGRELALKMFVSNQYQSSELEFTLDIGISLEYALKLLATYGGGLITVIGFLVYAPIIYNVLCKKFYRYPKDFVIKVGQEIDYNTLYPIPFIEQPLLESKIIIRHIEHKIKTQHQDSSKARIASYFTKPDTCHLDTSKLLKSIQNAASEIQLHDATKLKLFTSDHKELINELVINHFMLRLVDLDVEKATKRAFELVKTDLFGFVEFEKTLENGLCKFTVNKAMLLSKLKDHNIKAYPTSENEESQTNLSVLSSRIDPIQAVTLESSKSISKKSIEMKLISNGPNTHTNIRDKLSANVDLLVEIIEAYALKKHLVNASIVEVDIIVRRRLDKIWLLEGIIRFLKLDLKLAGFRGKTLIGYGIKYKVRQNLLVFSGTVNENAKDTTLVVQIVQRRRILRELWLRGVEAEEEKAPLINEIL